MQCLVLGHYGAFPVLLLHFRLDCIRFHLIGLNWINDSDLNDFLILISAVSKDIYSREKKVHPLSVLRFYV